MKRFLTILVIAAIALLAITAIAQAATTISVAATANYDGLGYTEGQDCTFTWFLNTEGVNNDMNVCDSAGNNYYEEYLTDSQLFTNFTGTGLNGTFTRPTAYGFSPFSSIFAGGPYGDNEFNIIVGSDIGSMGLTVDEQNIFYLQLRGLLTRTGFSGFTHSGEYVNPNSYLADFSGTYGFGSSDVTQMFIYNTNGDTVTFAPTSLTIATVGGSPVPEPGTILAAMSILGPAAMIFRRRKSA